MLLALLQLQPKNPTTRPVMQDRPRAMLLGLAVPGRGKTMTMQSNTMNRQKAMLSATLAKGKMKRTIMLNITVKRHRKPMIY